MKKQLFDITGDQSNNKWVAKEFFNSIYSQSRFLWALRYLAGRNGCVVNEVYCLFPDLTDPDPTYHFEGVMFGVGNDELIVSEDEFFDLTREACRRYLKQNPYDERELNEVVGNAFFAHPEAPG